MKRGRWFEVLFLLALVAVLAYFSAPSPRPVPQQTVQEGVLLVGFGNFEPAVLDWARQQLQARAGILVRVGLPDLGVDRNINSAYAPLLTYNTRPVDYLQAQAERAGCPKLAFTSDSLDSESNPVLGFWTGQAALVSDSLLPRDARLQARRLKLLLYSLRSITGQTSPAAPRSLKDLDAMPEPGSGDRP